jgi:Rrf2 family protein
MKIGISENTEMALQVLDRLVTEKPQTIKINDILKKLHYCHRQSVYTILSQLATATIIRLNSHTRDEIELLKHPGKISVMEVIDAVEGDAWRNQCLLKHTPCGDLRNCPVHDFWKKQRSQIERTLSHVTLEQWTRFEHRHAWRQAQVVH